VNDKRRLAIGLDDQRVAIVEPTKNAGMITILPILALVLAVVGLLSRIVIKTAARIALSPRASRIKISMYRSMNGESSAHLYRP
jgi:hypothetical protein